MDLRKLTRIQDSAKDVKLELASKFEDKLTKWLEMDSGLNWSKSLYFDWYRGKTITVKLLKEEIAVVDVIVREGEAYLRLIREYEGSNIIGGAVFDYIEGVIKALPHY